MAIEKAGTSSGGAEIGTSSSLARFHKVVLGWDYLRLLSDSKNRKQPEGLKAVKNTYANLNEYIRVFEPLLFEEIKAQIVQGRDEEDETDWQKGGIVSCAESEGFHKVSMAVHDNFRDEVSENDLLLLSSQKFEEGVKPNAYAFALVENRGGQGTVTVRTFLAGEVKNLETAVPEHSHRLLQISSLFQPAKTPSFLWILKICSLSTIMREYAAMHSLSQLPFKDLILSATERNKIEGREWNVPAPLMDYLQTNLNESQLDAIHVTFLSYYFLFILLRGPPGTGKTQTILGLLSAVLHSVPSRLQTKLTNWLKASPWLLGTNPRDMILPIDGDDGFYPTGNELKPEVVNSNRKYRAHVLVCAPSNSALDEIVLRVLQSGIHDENDNVYNPKIVRIGLKAHHSVQTVSMDYLVQRKLAASGANRTGSDRDRIRASILDEAAIVFSTLSFSGSSAFSRMGRPFDIVIIDEAAQAVEPAILVPLAHGCRQVFLVGDPVQLPATVISPIAEKLGYGRSLFKRFQEAGFPVQMLNIQYRMHPEISLFPSKEFYGGFLQDGESVNRKRPWHTYRCFGPFCFFDLVEGEESQPSGSGSWINEQEAEFITTLYHQLATRFPELKSGPHVAVISPYRYQVKILRDQFRATFGEHVDQVVDINTVDGFQGREKDVVLFSCVRANEGKGIGFVSDFRRMNVGITRARSSVLVVGSAKTLKQDEHWSNLVKSAEERNNLFEVPKPYAAFFGDDKLDEMRVKKLHEMEQRKAQAMEGGNDPMEKVQPMNVENGDNNAEEEVPFGDDDMDVDGADGYGDD
ncbi:putative helicase MAGATAMA 3-like protein [Carex littledalei]|uniref:Putative helicase MAGATAMA 3-like protein n=1 Tax=Carex littledalei TaxID=544730 RepID=A0A833REY2_9POAL|nr:putative helicase MAGATAMA 3-like protein [Carex littledalei]